MREPEALNLRRAVPADLAAVDRLLWRSYPQLLAADYPPSIQVLAFPIICRARPELLASGRYFVAQDPSGQIIAAGGWSGQGSAAEVRHVATDHALVRRGAGRLVMRAVLDDAALAGALTMTCLSTRTAVPFYTALGFEQTGPVDVPLAPGITFPAIGMQRSLLP